MEENTALRSCHTPWWQEVDTSCNLPSTCPLPCSCRFCPLGLTVETAEEYVKDGTADLVSFATTFLSTPNLPAAVAAGKRNKDLNLAGTNPAIW